MKSHLLPRTISVCLTFFAIRLLAAPIDDFGSAEPFKAGDTVCYVGDSITHGGTYHSIVTLFYATRFPDRPIQSWNCGIGGDRASAIMSDERFRLNTDILAHKPTVATIMLGMNDIGHTDYGPDKTGPEIEKRRQSSLESYNTSMQKLIALLQKNGARVILITPSIYDETTKLSRAKQNVGLGRDAALGQCAEKVGEWSKQYHTGLIKFHEVMNAITAREQARDPAFTVVGPDRVHPGPLGHCVMAYIFLKAQQMPRDVARITIDALAGKATESANCRIEKVKVVPGGAEFDCLARALPFVLPAEAREALALVPFAQELNQEPLRITGLAPGRYELRIDDHEAGTYSAPELAAGIDLAANKNTPDYQQSAEATKINAERAGAALTLRNFAAQYYAVSRAKVDVNDRPAVEKKLREQIEADKAAGKPADPRAEAVLNNPGEPAKSEKQFEELAAKLISACQPRQHHFIVSKKE